jgi:hypothetical protein
MAKERESLALFLTLAAIIAAERAGKRPWLLSNKLGEGRGI